MQQITKRLPLVASFLLVFTSVMGDTAEVAIASDTIPGDAGDSQQVTLGQAVYEQDCARCHGNDLGGEFGWLDDEDIGLSDSEIELILESIDNVAPAHDASGQTWQYNDDMLFKIIKEGPALALGKQESRMPGFGDQLDDQEIWAIVAFMKSQWQALD